MRERDLFIQALELDAPAERAAFLDNACLGNPALREQVEQLLAEHGRPDNFILDTPPAGLDDTVNQTWSERSGAVIGPYTLLGLMGEGGMGAVYMAEQSHPVRRTVAFKIIKPGMDTRQVIARFEAERQALALMDHPNIAKVLDAGTTEAGRPYFAMELVQGMPITKYCDDCQLSMRERLELFIPVCLAVQHAHQKGIVHRDLKPSNVMIALYDGHPVPKVIDFGIAKATGQKLTEETLVTVFGAVVGTLEYMSPEQAEFNQQDVDARSDVYSLGVLLYELLTGTTPFDGARLHQGAYDEVRRIIREEEPPKPSTRINTLGDTGAEIATRRKCDPQGLSQMMRRELDWIVMKCLEKDRTRRYDTASGLARDVERYLRNEPIAARPPTRIYRFRKLVRRNWVAFAAASIVLAALVVGLVSTWLVLGEREARQRVIAAAHEQQRLESLERGDLYARTGQWEKAAAEFASAIKRRPDEHHLYYLSAPIWLQCGDAEAYRRHRGEMLRRFADTTDPELAVQTAMACLLAPLARADLARVAQLVDQAGTSAHARDQYEFYLLALGLVHLRADEFELAIKTLDGMSRQPPDLRAELMSPANLVRAMAYHRLGETNNARLAFVRSGNVTLPAIVGGTSGWHDWLISQVLRREARGLLDNLSRADLLARQGNWTVAAAAYAQANQLAPANNNLVLPAATTALAAGDVAGYERICARALAQFAETSDPATADRVAKAGLLIVRPPHEVEPFARLAAVAVGRSEGHAWRYYFQMVRGMAAYRSGDWLGTLEWCGKSREQSQFVGVEALDFLLEAMANHRLERHDEAQAAMKRAAEFIDRYEASIREDRGGDWHDWLICQMFRREAEALLRTAPDAASNE